MYNIFEVVSCYGGDINYLYLFIEKFRFFNKNENFGIKF